VGLGAVKAVRLLWCSVGLGAVSVTDMRVDFSQLLKTDFQIPGGTEMNGQNKNS
jgi:hypothetical protein